MQKIYNYGSVVVIAGLALLLLFLQMCNGKKIGNVGDSGILRSDTVTQTKTVTKVYRDTVYKTKYVEVKPTEVPTPIYDNGVQRLYTDSTSTNDLTIYWAAKTTGTLDSIRHSYRLKMATERVFVDRTITNTKTITNTVPVNGLFLGADFGYTVRHKHLTAAVRATYVSKNGFGYSYAYDILNNEHKAGLSYRVINGNGRKVAKKMLK